MSKPKIKIGLYGKGALKGMFVTFAQEAMPDAVFYERSIRFLSFRKREIELGKKNYVDPGTAVRDKPLEKMDVRVHFEQTQFTDDDIKTTVTAIHQVNLQKKVLQLSAKEDNITRNNVERVFRDQALRIVGAIRSLAMHPINARVRADGSFAGRPSTFEGTGIGRAIGKMQGPLGLH